MTASSSVSKRRDPTPLGGSKIWLAAFGVPAFPGLVSGWSGATLDGDSSIATKYPVHQDLEVALYGPLLPQIAFPSINSPDSELGLGCGEAPLPV